MKRELTETQSANGFANRCLWVAARRSKLLPLGGRVDRYVIEQIAERIRQATAGIVEGETLFDAAARGLWVERYAKISEEKPGLYGALIARSEAHAIRIAMIYALLDGQLQIGEQHLRAVFEVVRYCNDSVRYIFGDATGDDRRR